MYRVIGNFGRSVALFVPTLFCLYGTNLYALNLFRFVSIFKLTFSDFVTGLGYGGLGVLSGYLTYLIFVGGYWGLLSIAWKEHPLWLSPKSWENISINWLIATSCLFLAFLCEPRLWVSGHVYTAVGREYTEYILAETAVKVISIWFALVNITYFFISKTRDYPKQNRPIASKDIRKQYPSQQPTDSLQSIPKHNISRSKFRELTKMVNGQEDVARRLIEGNLKLFPDRSPDWACDKAISDIERDRRI